MMSAPPRHVMRIIAEGVGQTIGPDGVWSKSRFWLWEDSTVTFGYADKNGDLQRYTVAVTAADFSGARASFRTSDGKYMFSKASCNCGMGVVAYAQPIEGRIELSRVAPPSWVTGL